jgi:hypothetical protein
MAIGSSTFSDIGGGISDLYAADADKARARGNRMEAQEYVLAANLADLNKKYTEESTAIKEYQADRDVLHTIGKQEADVAASGFTQSGSAIDLERDSAAQGALTRTVLGQQGLIEEQAYDEQEKSFQLMAAAANDAATAADHAAQGAKYGAYFKFAAAGASLIPTPTPGGGGGGGGG